MKYTFLDILTLIGSLGLFLFGMKLMSEALQKVAGDKMRKILSAMTSNRVMGVMTGFLITAIIQSSSATTVLVVSFVNAGLLSLIQSIGVIMGANIGTTVTAWLISILGFKIKISVIAIPLIGLGFPLVFSKNNRRRSWGEFIIGFSILFLGLDYLKSSVPDIKSNPEILTFLTHYTDAGFWSVLLFLGIGTLLTIIIQSSSATMALTLVMTYNGWIGFDLAAAMVLGENIGTTITANLAALVANVSAKRAALAHFIFNVFGVIWVLLIFRFFLNKIDWFVQSFHGTSAFTDTNIMPIALSIFHTSFNIINTFVLIWFAPLIKKTVELILPLKEDDEEEFRLKYIKTGLLSTSELSILQARREIILYAKRTKKMFRIVSELFNEQNEKKFKKEYSRIEKYEEISDRMEIEIATYLTKISEGELSKSGSKRIKSMLKLIDDIESIADSCMNIAKTIKRKREQKAWFTPEIRDNVNKMFEKVSNSLEVMFENLNNYNENVNIQKALDIEEEINKYRDELKIEHLESLEKKQYKYQAGVIYNDLFSEGEKLADYVINVSEAINESV
ncbi:MAG: Na/Pi cotransporter family protein [Chlorobi bacterium]|nr:Na/Pi cotransporter family protein [Chlorobiota bacterium]